MARWTSGSSELIPVLPFHLLALTKQKQKLSLVVYVYPTTSELDFFPEMS